MPIVQVMLLPGRSKEQKARTAQAITEALAVHCNAKPEQTEVVFLDVPAADWASGGRLLSETLGTSAPKEPSGG